MFSADCYMLDLALKNPGIIYKDFAEHTKINREEFIQLLAGELHQNYISVKNKTILKASMKQKKKA